VPFYKVWVIFVLLGFLDLCLELKSEKKEKRFEDIIYKVAQKRCEENS
jgi:hypothetical protein